MRIAEAAYLGDGPGNLLPDNGALLALPLDRIASNVTHATAQIALVAVESSRFLEVARAVAATSRP